LADANTNGAADMAAKVKELEHAQAEVATLKAENTKLVAEAKSAASRAADIAASQGVPALPDTQPANVINAEIPSTLRGLDRVAAAFNKQLSKR